MKIYRRAGSYYFRFSYRRRRYRRGGFPTAELAREAAIALRRSLAEDRVEEVYGVRVQRNGASPTLAAYLKDVYQPMILSRSAPSSHSVRTSQYRRLVARLGKIPLADLSPAVLDEYVAARYRDGVSPTQVANEMKSLNAIVNHALRGKALNTHPFRGRWRWVKARERDYRTVSPDEEHVLCAAATPEFRDWIVLALYTGMRKGELVALEPAHVDMGRREFRLRQSKTAHVKTIPMHDDVVAIIAARLRHKHSQLLAAPRTGRRRIKSWVDWSWTRTRQRAGVKGIRFHDLRHTFASRLAERESPATVGEILGHRPPYRTTLRYFHVLADAKRRAIDRLAGPRNGHTRPVNAESKNEKRQRSPREARHRTGRTQQT